MLALGADGSEFGSLVEFAPSPRWHLQAPEPVSPHGKRYTEMACSCVHMYAHTHIQHMYIHAHCKSTNNHTHHSESHGEVLGDMSRDLGLDPPGSSLKQLYRTQLQTLIQIIYIK